MGLPTVWPSIAARWRPKTSCSWVKCCTKATTSAWKRCVCTYCTEAICRLTRMSCSLRSRGSGRPYLGRSAEVWLGSQIQVSTGRKQAHLGVSPRKQLQLLKCQSAIRFDKANSNNHSFSKLQQLAEDVKSQSGVMATAVNRQAALALDSLLMPELTQKPPAAHTFHQGLFPCL